MPLTTALRSISAAVAVRADWFITVLLLLTSVTSAAAGEVDDRVLMLSADPRCDIRKNDAGQEAHTDTWTREMFRQALLMAARENFGLSTRDQTLGEPVDRESDDCFHMSVLPWRGGETEVEIRRGNSVLHEASFPIDPSKSIVLILYPHHSAVFREECVAVLQEAGFKPDQPPGEPLDEVPEDVRHLLARMDHVSQFAAVRRLHGLLREHGESPAVLGALSRGYAHLTQLTMPLLDVRHRAFAARALLYAHRVIELDIDSPLGFWNRAYAFSWLGYPDGAQVDLNYASDRVSDDVKRPAWVNLIEACVNYRFHELEDFVLDDICEFREAAALQWFRTSQMTGSKAFAIETGLIVREELPHCQGVIAGLFRTAGVALGHQTSRAGPPAHIEMLRERLPEMADLPEAIQDALKPNGIDLNDFDPEEFDPTPENLERLRAAIEGQMDSSEPIELFNVYGEDDRQEPSWHVLAENMRGWDTQHLFQRAHFQKNHLAWDSDEFVASTVHQMTDPRFHELYRTLGVSSWSSVEELSKVTRHMQPQDLNYLSVGYLVLVYLPREATTDFGTTQQFVTAVSWDWGHTEESQRVSYDLLTPETKPSRLDFFLAVSKKYPLYFSEQVVFNWSDVVDKVDEWSDSYSHYPDLQWALARSRKSYGDIDRAIEHYDIYLSMVSDPRGYMGLAEAWYMKDRDNDKWLEVLEGAFECEDYNLDHSRAAQNAASTLMGDGRFEDALPWAERAAEAYSGSGLAVLMDCLTGLEQYERAESIASAITGRYNGDSWYGWCVATGRGDRAAAWGAQLETLRGRLRPDDVDWIYEHALHYIHSDEDAKAMEQLQKMTEMSPDSVKPVTRGWAEIVLALLKDRAGDADQRDTLLKAMADRTREDPMWHPYCPLAAALLPAILHEKLDLPGLTTFAEQSDRNYWSATMALGGYFLKNRGQTDDAVEAWKKSASISADHWSRRLSWKWLRENGVNPTQIEGRMFINQFRREKSPMPPKRKP